MSFLFFPDNKLEFQLLNFIANTYHCWTFDKSHSGGYANTFSHSFDFHFLLTKDISIFLYIYCLFVNYQSEVPFYIFLYILSLIRLIVICKSFLVLYSN